MKYLYLLFSGLLLFLILGCGSEKSTSSSLHSTRAAITIQWPSRTRVLPKASESIKITVTGPFGYTATKTVSRPVGVDTTTVDFLAVPLGIITYSATTYPLLNAMGTPQASGTASGIAVAGQVLQVTMTLVSEIDHMSINPAAISVDQGTSKSLTVTAYNSLNDIVLVDPSVINWSSSNLGVATVASPGNTVDVFGVTENPNPVTITAHDTESGKSATSAVTVTAPPLLTKINPTDNATMVWVPAGTFTMGSINGVGDDDAHPAHQVTVSGYWMYKYEVTVGQYRKFCTDTLRPLPLFPSDYSWTGKSGWDDASLQQHPIVNVSWYDCKAYADWAGGTLPTEAQWEYASRGSMGNNYPWGGTEAIGDLENGLDLSRFANHSNSANQNISTWPVGSFPSGASWCGAQDLAGNVWEWCSDWFDLYPNAPVVNPTGPVAGIYRIVRGGGWPFISVDDYIFGRGAYRYDTPPGSYSDANGLRCVVPGP